MANVMDVPVTIVGGGPVGLALALALALQGIESRVLELKATTTDHPKARGCLVRSMEIFRQWGIEDPVRARGLPDGADVFAVVDGMGGRELGRSEPEPNLGQSPSRKSIVAQDAVEDELVAALQGQPLADVRFSTEFMAAEEGIDGVVVNARDLQSGEILTWKSTYVIGAEGGAGCIAKAGGFEFDSRPASALWLNTYFHADLSRFEKIRYAGGIFCRPEDPHEQVRVMLNTNGADRWLLITRVGTTTDERDRPLTEAETIETIRSILRVADLDVSIINEGYWRTVRSIAKSFRQGRYFLVGDAAHRFSPTGGFGMNSGIQDVHNLAWKLAFVLKGWSSEALLDSYDVERRPAAHSNADIADINNSRMPRFQAAIASGNEDRITFWLRDMDNHQQSVGQSLGYIYSEGALVPDGSTVPAHTTRLYTPYDRPGSRFPHMWLDTAKTRSTIDLFNHELVLVCGPAAHSWLAAAPIVSERLSIPIQTCQLAAADRADGIHMGPKGAALVRPDGVVAWRIGWEVDDPASELASVVGALFR